MRINAVLILFLSGLMCGSLAFSGGQQEYGTGITWNLARTGVDFDSTVGSDGYSQNGVVWDESTRFEALNSEVMVDLLTGLMWTRVPDEIIRTWPQAVERADVIEVGGFDDWRLPNIRELRSLIHHGRDTSGWLEEIGFSNIYDGEYWSSTTYFHNTDLAWHLDFRTGRTNPDDKTDLRRILMVR